MLQAAAENIELRERVKTASPVNTSASAVAGRYRESQTQPESPQQPQLVLPGQQAVSDNGPAFAP